MGVRGGEAIGCSLALRELALKPPPFPFPTHVSSWPICSLVILPTSLVSTMNSSTSALSKLLRLHRNGAGVRV